MLRKTVWGLQLASVFVVLTGFWHLLLILDRHLIKIKILKTNNHSLRRENIGLGRSDASDGFKVTVKLKWTTLIFYEILQ